MRPLFVSLLLLGVSGALDTMSFARNQEEPGTLDLIAKAYQNGQIDHETSLLHRVQSIKDRRLLPAHLDAGEKTIAKCASPILAEVIRDWNLLSPATQSSLNSLMARPNRQYSYVSPSNYFKIHYNKTGSHAVPSLDDNGNDIPDYVEWLGDYADSVWRTQVANLGYFDPPSDGGAGGDNRYDIYTENMPYYGYAQPESPGPKPWDDYTSYISVHRDFYGFPPNQDPDGNQKGAMKVTLAHEFFHAIEFAYDVYEDIWYMETSSTWMEDVVYDVVNDCYNYLPHFFDHPEESMQSTSIHMYANYIWNSYLSENFGLDAVWGIWNGCVWHDGLWSLDSVLFARGSSRDEEFKTFTAWNFVTGNRDDGIHYDEGSEYPLIELMRTHSDYPVTDLTSSHPPDNLAANYVMFFPPDYGTNLHLSFDGHDSYAWGAMVAKSQGLTNHSFEEIALDGSQAGEIVVPDFDEHYAVTLIPSVLSTWGYGINYSYSAYLSTSDTTYGAEVQAGGNVEGINASTVMVDFYLENTGILPDTFDLTVTDSLGWELSPAGLWMVLNPQQTDTLGVEVTIPHDVELWSEDAVIASAVSRGNPLHSDSDTARVVVNSLRGDTNGDENIDVGDVVYLVNYLYKGGPAPAVVQSGDVNCDDSIDVGDVVSLVNYLYRDGPSPCSP
ncbi:MAG: hypothetical protein JSV10_03205 [Candidatus Zixiibacteriota bacterium]|nr:MAG: hypothetical protein JSV10_03205 [candidate division Zixibacteria bacterium]